MNAKNSDKITYLSKAKNGRYKYQRRKPKYAHDALGKKPWDISLGSNYGVAVDKAREYAASHDELLSHLATPENQDKYKQDKYDEVAAMLVRMRPNMRLRIGEGGEPEVVPPMNRNPGQWKQTSDKMKNARTLPPQEELQQLAYFAAYAFGDRETLDVLDSSNPLGDALVEVMQPQRPTDPVDSVMYDAMKKALDDRIRKLGGETLVNPKHTLTYLHKVIASLRNSKPNTIRNHKVTTTKFLKFLQEENDMTYEPSIATLSHELLQEYLEYLMADSRVGNSSISKYFDGINSVFNHAIKTKKVPGLVVNPIKFLEMPASKPVEESMYLPFDREEIKRIWEQVQIEWDPGNRKSQLSQGRRSAFLMGFRVLLWSSLRPVEFFWLRDHGGVTPEYIDVQRTKTGIKRKIALSSNVADFHKFVQNGGFEECIY